MVTAYKLKKERALWGFSKVNQRLPPQIEKLAKASDTAAKALEAIEATGKNAIEITKLEQLGGKRTIKQDRELHKLKLEEMKNQQSLKSAMMQMQTLILLERQQNAKTLSGMSDSGRTSEETLRAYNLVLQRSIALEQGKKDFSDQVEDEFDYYNMSGIIGASVAAVTGLITMPLNLAAGKGFAISGAAGIGAYGAADYALADDMTIDGKQISTERSFKEVEAMTDKMRTRAFEVHQSIQQGLYGGDTDQFGNIRSEEQKNRDLAYNQGILENVQRILENDDKDLDKALEELENLKGSTGAGEIRARQLREAIADAMKTGDEFEDNLFGLTQAESHAVGQGFIGTIMNQNDKSQRQYDEAQARKQQVLMDIKNFDIQKKILKNQEMLVAQQIHELEMRGRALSLDHEIEKTKQDLLKKHGLLLNSVDVETKARHASESATQKYNEGIK